VLCRFLFVGRCPTIVAPFLLIPPEIFPILLQFLPVVPTVPIVYPEILAVLSEFIRAGPFSTIFSEFPAVLPSVAAIFAKVLFVLPAISAILADVSLGGRRARRGRCFLRLAGPASEQGQPQQRHSTHCPKILLHRFLLVFRLTADGRRIQCAR
jgi:hypothetical protein